MSVVSVYAVFADADEAERIGRLWSRSGLPPASNPRAMPLDLPLARRGRDAPTKSPRSSRPPTKRRRADRADRRAAQLRRAVRRRLAESTRSSRGYAQWVEDSVRLDRQPPSPCPSVRRLHPACVADPRSLRRPRRQLDYFDSSSASSGVCSPEVGHRQPASEYLVAANFHFRLVLRRSDCRG